MADRITENRNGRQEGTATEGASPAAPAPQASFAKAWLPLIITIVAMPALAYATTRFVLVPEMTRALKHTSAPSEEAAKTDKDSKDSKESKDGEGGSTDLKNKYTVPLSKILVNVAGTMGTRYLMTSITLVSSDPDLKQKVDDNRDQLMDLATSALCTKTITDLEKPGARNIIRSELITIFNNALGSAVIKEIYITELAIQ
ncbi:MAG TPA: flagellar basal body-associated FliL family protein [Verrucomicrobiae bacterium]|jgi:flagellar FliL protein|nr:flagellar basal body-associated FliL family protein [Verrucomicrobiae bacterium]